MFAANCAVNLLHMPDIVDRKLAEKTAEEIINKEPTGTAAWYAGVALWFFDSKRDNKKIAAYLKLAADKSLNAGLGHWASAYALLHDGKTGYRMGNFSHRLYQRPTPSYQGFEALVDAIEAEHCYCDYEHFPDLYHGCGTEGVDSTKEFLAALRACVQECNRYRLDANEEIFKNVGEKAAKLMKSEKFADFKNKISKISQRTDLPWQLKKPQYLQTPYESEYYYLIEL
ncbi:MAG: hypothetical protein WC966_01170 [Bradymonadales bacterium]|jgi:hypothetical protein